jgi:uncharacterized membrane protein
MSSSVGDEINKKRLEYLTDAVLAIVMTLLVLEITVPQLSHTEASTELTRELVELWPMFLSYATSFIILGFAWIGDIDQLHLVKRVNRTFLWLTILYLMFIAVIPFSTALLGEYGDQQISVIIYGINLLVAAFWYNVKWWYASRNHLLIDKNSDPNIIRAITRRHLIAPIMYSIAIAMSYASLQLSIILYIATPLYFLLPILADRYIFGSEKRFKNESSNQG